MVVNSYSFLIFFVIVFFIYYLPVFRKTPKFQNLWLLVVSYVFYGYADWQMIPLLLGSTIVFWLIGHWLRRQMDKGHTKAASHITTFSVVLGVALLLYFKYLNFFAESLADLLSAIGLQVSWNTLNIILPIGVSFFTFKLISYIIEIHREHIMPSKDLTEFAAYIAFFPTILSGPIDRPDKFLPQMQKVHTLDYPLAADGCRQILWGMFTKMCIADNLAIITNQAWNNIEGMPSTMLLAAALLYPLQLYADFDGYSNMAIGVGKLLGYQVNRNFNHPFLARNMAEYWRRWHMSLTGWITDYVFMPLNIAFRNIGNWGIVMAAMINLILIGLWHGANWTYGVFGFYHGLLFIPLILSGAFGKNKKLKANDHGLPFLKDFGKMILTYCLVAIGLVIFHAENIAQAFEYLYAMVSNGFSGPNIIDSYGKLYILFGLMLLVIEWIQRKEEHALQLQAFKLFSNQWMRFAFYLFIILLIITFTGKSQAFIYFQF